MRPVHALFIVSVLLFVCGIGFVVAGARASRSRVGPAPAGDVLTPVASVRQIMQAIVGPAADVVFGAVSTTVTAAGTEEKAPTNDEEWEAVASSAAALVESGNLMLMGRRAVDTGGWTTYSRDLITSAAVALKAAQAKDARALFDSGEAIYTACDNCHRTYQRTE